MKKKIFYLITFFLIIILTFLFSEIFLRIYSKITPVFFAPKDKKYNQFRPFAKSMYNGFQLNSGGFHDTEFIQKKKDGVFRILAIGDSFTFGVVPYKNNFITILEDSLKEKNPALEIYNMGIPSTTVRDYLSLILDEGLELNPNIILLNIYIGNDIIDTENKKESPSYLVQFIKYFNAIIKYNKFGKKTIGQVSMDKKEKYYDDTAKELDDKVFYQIQKGLFFIYLNNNHVIGSLNTKYHSIFKDLNTLNEICKSRKIKLIVTMLPSEIQVDRDLQKNIEGELIGDTTKEISESSETISKSINYSLPNKIIKNELEKLNIQNLDLLEPFKEKALLIKLYRPNDTHWNIAGNLLAAELLRNYFLNSGLIPTDSK